VKHQAKKSLKAIQSTPFEVGSLAAAAALAGYYSGTNTQYGRDIHSQHLINTDTQTDSDKQAQNFGFAVGKYSKSLAPPS
jgi:hypothetical protein